MKNIVNYINNGTYRAVFSQQSWWISCADKKEKTKDDTKIKALIIIVNILVFTSKKIVLLS